MTEEDYLTLTLGERIVWLRSEQGPRGSISHDTLAGILGTSRQVVIKWEKPGGAEPNPALRRELAKFSGFREGCFSRRQAEVLVQEPFGRRLQRAEETVETILAALVAAGIALPESEAEPRSAPISRRKRTA